MTKQNFFSWMVYDVLKAGATNLVFKHVGGVVIVTYSIGGRPFAETIANTTSPVRVARYRGWFDGLCAGHMDSLHTEALDENSRFNWLRARFGIFHVSRNDVKRHMLSEAHDEALRIERGDVYLVEQGPDSATFGNVLL